MRFLDSEVSVKTIPESVEGCGTFIECSCRYVGSVKNDGLSSADQENKSIVEFKIDSLLKNTLGETKSVNLKNEDFFFYGSGWQSWGFGGELAPGQKQKNYIPLIPQWKKYTTFPGKWPSKIGGKKSTSPKILKGQFLIYLRWENTYLVLASTGAFGNDDGEVLPPVQYFVDKKNRTITVSVYADGKRWSKMELMGKIVVFSANNFFALKEGIKFVYGKNTDTRFDYLRFLSGPGEEIKCAGWESWYNHYADINQKLIQDDLECLGKNGNIINSQFKQKDLPVVFQVDDGWEQSLGDWDANLSRFPDGMTNLATSISERGYIPGLWIAPFIVDLRSKFAATHPDWILKGDNGKPVFAGMNPLWGAKFGSLQPSYPCSYFCLDLSRDDVLEYLDDLMDKVVNNWGFRYIKLDFLFAGMLKGKFANGGAAFIWYDRAIKKITRRLINENGERVAYLGCGLPFESSFTSLPLSRIGPDTKECWDLKSFRRLNYTARTGAKPNLQSTLGHAFWNQSVYVNDPDVVFLRYANIKMDDSEKQLIALVNKLFASQLMHSDDPTDFSSDDADLTQQIVNLYELLEGEEFGFINRTSEVYQIFSKSGNYCGVINLSEKPFTIRKNEFLNQVNFISGKNYSPEIVELTEIVDNCVTAGDLYTSERHTISIYKITSENMENSESESEDENETQAIEE